MKYNSLKANSSSASQKIPSVLWNTEGSFPHSQDPATHPYAQINPVHVPPSHLLKNPF